MRLIDQVRLLGKTGFRTESPREIIILKDCIGPHICASRTLHERRMSDRNDAGYLHITALSPYHYSVESHCSQLSTAVRQERLGRWLSIQEIMIAPIDTKVSIGTFVQLIRILISGSIKKSGRI